MTHRQLASNRVRLLSAGRRPDLQLLDAELSDVAAPPIAPQLFDDSRLDLHEIYSLAEEAALA